MAIFLPGRASLPQSHIARYREVHWRRLPVLRRLPQLRYRVSTKFSIDVVYQRQPLLYFFSHRCFLFEYIHYRQYFYQSHFLVFCYLRQLAFLNCSRFSKNSINRLHYLHHRLRKSLASKSSNLYDSHFVST